MNQNLCNLAGVIDQYFFCIYCILCGQIKGFNSSITSILCEVGSYWGKPEQAPL